MDDPQVPFAEPLSSGQWAIVRVVAVVLTGLAWATEIAVAGPVTPAGPWWTVVRYLAAGAARFAQARAVSTGLARFQPVVLTCADTG